MQKRNWKAVLYEKYSNRTFSWVISGSFCLNYVIMNLYAEPNMSLLWMATRELWARFSRSIGTTAHVKKSVCKLKTAALFAICLKNECPFIFVVLSGGV